MTPEQLEQVKAELLSTKETLTKRLEKIEGSKLREGGALSLDWSQQAVEMENFDVVDALEESEIKELEMIQHALERIDKGTYGKCESCGKDIGEARIMAIPYSTICINCAE